MSPSSTFWRGAVAAVLAALAAGSARAEEPLTLARAAAVETTAFDVYFPAQHHERKQQRVPVARGDLVKAGLIEVIAVLKPLVTYKARR